MSDKDKGGKERRKARRRPILDSFSFFVVVNQKGDFRLKVNDLSEGGIGFDFDFEGASPDMFPVKNGEALDLQFHLNQSLYLPLKVKVVRVDDSKVIRRIGAEFVEDSSAGLKALRAILEMIDQVSEVVKFIT